MRSKLTNATFICPPGDGHEKGHAHTLWGRRRRHGERSCVHADTIDTWMETTFQLFQFHNLLMRSSESVHLKLDGGQPLCIVSQSVNQSVPLQQVAHSTCGDSEYNLRSRTVVCGSCGLPSDKSSSCSVTSASRSYRSGGGGGGLSEGLLPHSYVFSTSTPHKVTPLAPPWKLQCPCLG